MIVPALRALRRAPRRVAELLAERLARDAVRERRELEQRYRALKQARDRRDRWYGDAVRVAQSRLLGDPGFRYRRRDAEAEARHRALATRSEAYREAVDGNLDEQSVETVTIGASTWRLPRGTGGALASRIRAARLPLDDILLTRQFVVGEGMLDIGANVGTTAIPRVLLGDFQFVYAAEPEPLNYACLVRNIVENGLIGRVLPDRVAVGSSTGETALLLRNTGTHRLSTAPTGPSVRVPTLRLDEWIERMEIDLERIAFIKCDTQGWEGHILHGAVKTLAHRHIVWQLEMWPAGLEGAGFTLEALCTLVAAHFSHFIEIGGVTEAGLQPTAQLFRQLRHLGEPQSKATDVLVFNLGEGA